MLSEHTYPFNFGHLWICKDRTWQKITDKSVSLCHSEVKLAANYPITSNLWRVFLHASKGEHRSVLPRYRKKKENRAFECLFLQTGKTQGIYKKYLKIWIYRQFIPTQETFEVLIIKRYIGFVVECSYNLLTYAAIFELVDSCINGLNFCNKFHCFCDCSLREIIWYPWFIQQRMKHGALHPLFDETGYPYPNRGTLFHQIGCTCLIQQVR